MFDWLRRKRPQKKYAAPAKAAPSYAAAEIIPCGDGCCRAVREIAGQRFLLTKVPHLPLPTCDRAQCGCTYKRHKDRRAGQRRFATLGLATGPADVAGERRTAMPGGRRSTDRR
jgi:hypothetical protein